MAADVRFLNPASLDFRMTSLLVRMFPAFTPSAQWRYTVATEICTCPANCRPRNSKAFHLSNGLTSRRASLHPSAPPSSAFSKLKTARISPWSSLTLSPMPKATTCWACWSAANFLRAELAGNIVTYVVNRNINFTNICFVGCKFCAFSRGPRESDTYFHTLEDMARKAVEAWQLGATEVCIQGGLPHGLPTSSIIATFFASIKNAVPQMHIHAFSPMEIVYGVELTGMPLADYLVDAARQWTRYPSRHCGGNSRRRDSPHSFRQQAFDRAVDRSHPHRASLRHSHALRR